MFRLPRWTFLFASTITAFCGTFQMSYHAGIINPPEVLFQQFINDTNVERTGQPMSDISLNILWGWIVCLSSVGAVVGCLISPYLAENYGRKLSTMILSNLISIISSLLMSFCLLGNSYEMLAVGRLLNGFGQGLATTVLPIYLTECSPVEYRGFMGSLQNVFVNVQTVLSFILASPGVWGNLDYLPYLLGFGIIPSVVQIFTYFWLPESPKYLYIKKRNANEAERSLRFWNAERRPLTSVDVKKYFLEFDQEQSSSSSSEEIGFCKAIKDPYFRRIFAVASAINACQNLTAVGPVFSYSTVMFENLGFTSSQANMFTNLLAVVNLIGAVAISPYVEKYPRRQFFFVGNILLVISLVAYTLFCGAYDYTRAEWTAYTSIAMLLVYCLVYNMGAGVLVWIIPSEIAPQAIRSSVVSVSSGVGWILSLICTALYPPIASQIGSWSYFLYIIPLIVLLIYLYKYMPETRGKTTTEIYEENTTKMASGADEKWEGEKSPNHRRDVLVEDGNNQSMMIHREISVQKF